jgi:hypothetical protein
MFCESVTVHLQDKRLFLEMLLEEGSQREGWILQPRLLCCPAYKPGKYSKYKAKGRNINVLLKSISGELKLGCPSKLVSIRKTTETGTETSSGTIRFLLYTETANFGVSIEPKQTEDQPKTKRNESNLKNI